MSGQNYEKILAKLVATKKECATLRNEIESIYAEVKALRKSYKKNNKILTALRNEVQTRLYDIAKRIGQQTEKEVDLNIEKYLVS